jgi:hypothetical protein
MPFPTLLLALLLVLAPWPARAQSIFNNAGPTTPGRATASPPDRDKTAGPKTQKPASPGMPAPAREKIRTGQPAPRKQHQKQPAPPGSVFAPPGSLVRPPSSVRPPATRSKDRDKRRMSATTRCNQEQISCNRTCNSRTMGGARTLCYRQCYSKFLHCVNQLNVLP